MSLVLSTYVTYVHRIELSVVACNQGGGNSVVVLATPNPAGSLFTTMLVVAFACKLLEVIHVVSNVVTVNVFFIDWEQVRHRRPYEPTYRTHGGRAAASTPVLEYYSSSKVLE